MNASMLEIFARAVLVLVPMILSLTVHEFSHGRMAKALGDDTADKMGRLTLNPIAHIDPVGTILLPLMILLASGAINTSAIPFFGWAKPVPYNPARFRRNISMRTGAMLTAAAGPLSNLALGIVCAGGYSVAMHLGFIEKIPEGIATLLVMMLQMNIALFVFNMLPVYPLDGQKIVSGLLPHAQSQAFEHFNYRFGQILLIFLIIAAPRFMAVPVALVRQGVMLLVGLG
jgi:Zn-dependent protease